VHFPDGGKLKSEKDAFWRDFETCVPVSKADEPDIKVIVGDFNASMGVSTGDYDLMCGNEGIPHQNENGRRLKSFVGMQDLVDLVSWEKQNLPATHYDMRTRMGRQLDRVLMRQSDRDMVVTCSNVTMLVNSDHETVVVTLSLAFDAPKHKTVRSTRSRKDIALACSLSATRRTERRSSPQQWRKNGTTRPTHLLLYGRDCGINARCSPGCGCGDY
jgi:hypothetical protein